MKIIEFVENVKIGVLGSIGLSALVYTVLSTVQKIESSLNYIWNIKGTRSLSERFVNYLSVLLIGPVLVFSAIGITASLMSSTVMKKLMAIHLLGLIIYIISRIMPYLLISAAFTFIYISLPNTKVRFRAAFAGGISAAFLWQTIGWIFTSFIATSAQYSAIYSGFASLILFLIWLYWNYLTLLLGARVSFYSQHPELLEAGGRASVLSERLREKLALGVMFLIGRNFHHNKAQWRLTSLTRQLGMSAEFVREIISDLQEKGLLVPTQSEPPAYLPGKDLDIITLDEIIGAVRSAGEAGPAPGKSLSSLSEVEVVMSTVEEGITASLNQQTLKDLILAADKRGTAST
jgi:membrane protein